MKYSKNKELVALFAKTALLENELAEAIEAEDRARKEEQPWLDQSSKHIIAGVLVSFGVVIAWIAYLHFYEVVTGQTDLNPPAVRSVQRQREIAQPQVNPNRPNEQSARDQERLDERAWTWLTGIAVQPMVANQPIWITANMVNTGKTVAVHAERTDAVVLATKEPATFPTLGKWKNIGVLTPGSTYRDGFKGTEGLTQQEINAISSGSLLLVMYGTLKYDDVFGTPHFTDYCLVYGPNTSGFSNCQRHNRAN